MLFASEIPRSSTGFLLDLVLEFCRKQNKDILTEIQYFN